MARSYVHLYLRTITFIVAKHFNMRTLFSMTFSPPPSLYIVLAETVISLIGFGNTVPTAASFGEEGRHVCCCYHRVYGRWPQRIGVHI